MPDRSLFLAVCLIVLAPSAPAEVATNPAAENMRRVMGEQLKQIEAQEAYKRERTREMMGSDGAPQDPTTSAPGFAPAQRRAPRCIYGADGNAIHVPAGMKCPPWTIGPRPKDFSTPTPRGHGWSPVRVGEEALFRVVVKREVVQGPQLKVTEGFEGTQHLVTSRGAQDQVRVSVTTRLRQGEGRPDDVQEDVQYMARSGDGYQITAIELALAGSSKRIPLDSPAPLVPPSMAVGTKWVSSSFDHEGLRYHEEGEIKGFQDAKTPAGVFANCAVVHYVGRLEGVVEMDGQRVRIENGEIERTQWAARGVGPVLRKETFKATIVARTGQRLRTTAVQQAALYGTRDSVPAAQR